MKTIQKNSQINGKTHTPKSLVNIQSLLKRLLPCFIFAAATTPLHSGSPEEWNALQARWKGDIVFLPPVKDVIDLDNTRKALEAKLMSTDPTERRNSAEQLGYLLDVRALPSLNSLLNDPEQSVREQASSSIDSLVKFFNFTSLRPPSSFLFHPRPVLASIEQRPVKGKDKAGNDIVCTLELWTVWGQQARKIIPNYAWAGQHVVMSEIGGFKVDQRLLIGNLVYFLVDKSTPAYAAAYFTASGELYRKWTYSDHTLSLENGPFIEFVDVEKIEYSADTVTYQLVPRGRLLFAKDSQNGQKILAVGEQFKNQSGGSLSVRDWLLRSSIRETSFCAALTPDLEMFRLGRTAFTSTDVKAENQVMGMLQLTDNGVRLLSSIDLKSAQYALRNEEIRQGFLLPQPMDLHVAEITFNKQVLKPSPLLPSPSGAGFEVERASIDQTRALVRQIGNGAWNLIPEKESDQIVVIAYINLLRKELNVQPLFGEGSVLRFGIGAWVDYQGASYSEGSVTISINGNHFSERTLKKQGGRIHVYQDGKWSEQR